MTVTKQQQLEWLAKNRSAWDFYLGGVMMSALSIGVFCGESPSCQAWFITREEWQRERDKMHKQDVKVMNENEFEDELEKMYWDFDAERAKKSKCERLNFKMFMRMASGLTVERKQDNSWHERGELPQVGIPVELWVCGSFAYNCEFISRRGNNYVLWNLDSDKADSVDYMHSQFRQLRTEREKAIDAMIEIICAGGELSKDGSAAHEIAERILESGFHK